MRIEHFAYAVKSPAESAQWYVDTFGFSIKRATDVPHVVRFLADISGEAMLEIYNNPKVQAPDYSSMDPLLLHVAFCCEDLPTSIDRLVSAGATLVSGPETTEAGDELAMFRDPWGLAIQLCKRANPMIGTD
jgi:glyoxylase I family protein